VNSTFKLTDFYLVKFPLIHSMSMFCYWISK